MSEIAKFITQKLNEEPFKKNLNLISFDSLDSVQLLQTLNDVLAEIDKKHKIDIREESSDMTALRMIEALRIFRYKPPATADELQGIVMGDKRTIYPILEWCLKRIPELKRRAYLACFMVKINVPTDFMQDEEISTLYR
ncbi:unnamed protein product, partial [Protopolystoma xenopodis]